MSEQPAPNINLHPSNKKAAPQHRLPLTVSLLRKGFDGLAASVQERMAQDPFCGHLFVFRGRRGDLLKVLWWDGQGLCLFAKRLEKGRFVWPSRTRPVRAALHRGGG